MGGQVPRAECVREITEGVMESFMYTAISDPAEQPPASCPIDGTPSHRSASKTSKLSKPHNSVERLVFRQLLTVNLTLGMKLPILT